MVKRIQEALFQWRMRDFKEHMQGLQLKSLPNKKIEYILGNIPILIERIMRDFGELPLWIIWTEVFESLYIYEYIVFIESTYPAYLLGEIGWVIKWIWNWTLIYVEHDEIKKVNKLKRPRKGGWITPFTQRSDTQLGKDDERIRKHFSQENFRNGDIDGIIISDIGWKILWCIYFNKVNNKEYIIMDRQIAESPEWAIVVMRLFQEKYQEIKSINKRK